MARKPRPWFRLSRGWFVTINGTQHNLNVSDPSDEAAAFAAFQQLLRTLRPGTDPSIPDTDSTVADAVAAFLAGAGARLEPSTVKGYAGYLAQFVARFGTVRVSAVTREQVEADARGRATWSDDTRRNYLQVIEVLFKHAGRPMRFAKPSRGSAGADAVIPEPTYHMAVGAARGDIRALLVCLWNTGCRPSELRSLTVEVVDWDGGTATLRKHKTSRHGKAARLLVFPPEAIAVLRSQREKYGAGLLFRTRLGTAYTCAGLTQAVWRISRRIGRPITAYGFRHSLCTRALEMGVPETHVAALMGHTSTRMIHAHYNHLSANTKILKETAARIAGRGTAG